MADQSLQKQQGTSDSKERESLGDKIRDEEKKLGQEAKKLLEKLPHDRAHADPYERVMPPTDPVTVGTPGSAGTEMENVARDMSPEERETARRAGVPLTDAGTNGEPTKNTSGDTTLPEPVAYPDVSGDSAESVAALNQDARDNAVNPSNPNDNPPGLTSEDVNLALEDPTGAKGKNTAENLSSYKGKSK